MAPLAGYIYSGPVAATAYAALGARRGEVRRVVLLGPSHNTGVEGLAVPTVDRLDTPLGALPIDDEARRVVLALPGVLAWDVPHAQEHSLEVHLPFILTALGAVSVLPILVGWATDEEVAAVIDAVWGGPETAIVVSSDLSHYHPYDVAVRLDGRTAAAVEGGRPQDIAPADACGAIPVRGLLVAAARHGLRARVIDLRNSGDTAGPRDRVVGYGAFAVA